MTLTTHFQKFLFFGEVFSLMLILLIYSCGNSMLWFLLSIEHDDIEYYYSKDGSGGASYVNSLLNDTEESNANNAPSSLHTFSWLLKSYSAVKLFEPLSISIEIGKNSLFALFLNSQSLDGFSSIIFHPPTC